MSLIDQLKRVWDDVYDLNKDVVEVIETHFHPDYKQCINGVVMNRDEYIDHVISQKENMIVDKIEYLQAVENGDKLFALYMPKGKKRDGAPIEAEVVSYFRFLNEKILEVHGQVRLLSGKPVDVDM